MKQANMKDLAKALNLSTATVSKALRDAYDISEETKQRVLQLAKELQYTPNAHASSLRGRKSKTIAIVIPAVADSFFAQVINGVEEVVRDEGYHVLVYLTHERVEKEQGILQELQNGKVDGVLLSLSAETRSFEHIQQLQASGMPIILFDRTAPKMGDACVVTDDEESCYTLSRYLIELGCKSIAFLTISETLSITQHRMKGYYRALMEYAPESHQSNILYCGEDEGQNYQLIKKLLSSENKPDAVIAVVEKLVLPVYLACQELGLSIPNNVKVAAFANLPTAKILNPPLSTITQPAFEMGKVASQLLLKKLKGKILDQEESLQVIPSKMEIRASIEIPAANQGED